MKYIIRLLSLLNIHIHQWAVTYAFSFRGVRRCECGKVQSLIMDQDKGKRIWSEGNFYEKKDPSQIALFVMTGTSQEFTEALEVIVKENPNMADRVIFPLSNWNINTTPDILKKNPQVPIIFYGTWYENEALASLEFTTQLNKRMTGE
jgi:hypothetical protein